MKTNIIVNFRFEGIHQWSACPLEDVAFLKTPHRHIFHVCAKKQVSHDDRDIEIIMLKREMERTFSAHKIPINLGNASCEKIAKHFVKTYKLDYCSVLEDGENGAEVWAQEPTDKTITPIIPAEQGWVPETKPIKKAGDQLDIDDILNDII